MAARFKKTSSLRYSFATSSRQAPISLPYFTENQSQLRYVASVPVATPSNSRQPAPFSTLPLSWPHKGWDHNIASQIVPSHRPPRTISDKLAYTLIRICRWGMDFVSGMPPESPGESLAGIPGLVAGSLRHLSSIRRFAPDQGWVKTLLEESYNERMHLLTFLEIYKPGLVMRALVFAAQGVFYNTLFLAYLISPKFVHRFVGYLEEEAVHTYSRCLREMDKGLLPKWTEDKSIRIPEVAVKYWGMEGRRTMRDLVLYVRADEASHRGVNHTLGNLDQLTDPNPFIEAHATENHMVIAAVRPAGLEREEVVGKQ
ncbi:alternative oxidase-domain-containing protein [Podospora fimiseda]|uniref:Alternative oxidase n=1 Tax=Podospora fimiseda TaxID=252190 RepID=A0AAN7H462_9PEZI|nr:alternative oxidase-domain-containing protein [Podospora fimiseda]